MYNCNQYLHKNALINAILTDDVGEQIYWLPSVVFGQFEVFAIPSKDRPNLHRLSREGTW